MGNQLSSQLWTHLTPQTRNFRWLRTAKPTHQERATWQWAITQSFSLGCNQTLLLTLVPWLQQHELTTWYYDPLDSALFHQQKGEWTTYTLIPKCTRCWLFHSMGHTTTEHPDISELQIASVEEHGHNLQITGWGPQLPKQDTTHTDWVTRMRGLPYARDWELQILVEGDMAELLKAIQQGTQGQKHPQLLLPLPLCTVLVIDNITNWIHLKPKPKHSFYTLLNDKTVMPICSIWWCSCSNTIDTTYSMPIVANRHCHVLQVPMVGIVPGSENISQLCQRFGQSHAEDFYCLKLPLWPGIWHTRLHGNSNCFMDNCPLPILVSVMTRCCAVVCAFQRRFSGSHCNCHC